MREPTYRFPEAEVTSAIGTVRVWSTGAEHVGVSDPERPYAGNPKPGSITVRGIPYRVRIDLHPAAYHVAAEGEPSWKADTVEAYPFAFDSLRLRGGGYYLAAVLMHRSDGRWPDDASEAAKRKALEVLVPAVNAFLETDEGRTLLREGEAEHVAQEIARAETQYEKAAEELSFARAKLRQLQEPTCYGMLDESATLNDAGELRCPHGQTHSHALEG